ncbi:MAG: glycosyltransferase [Solirubrobacteraceae bacterium]|nr:glycosyltransferase [Solirubrobacteraceae bacterium]
MPTLDPEAGGPPNSATNSTVAVGRRGVATTFVFTGDARSQVSTRPARERMAEVGARTLLFPRPPRFEHQAGYWGVSLPLVVWLIRNIRRFDIVHLHYVWTLSTVTAAIAGALTGRRVVLTPHESLTRFDIDVESGSTPKKLAKLAIRSLIMRCVDVVVTASELEHDDSLEPGEHGVVIPHAVVDQAITEATPEPASPPLTIGFLGRLASKKNVDVLLEALAALPFEDARLVVCGDGDDRSRLEAIAADLQVTDRVDWRGHVTPSGRRALFDECHFTVMASSYEGFGMAAAEALAAGVPVIVSDRTGLAPVVREFNAGTIVEHSDVQSLVAGVLELSTEEERRPRRAAAVQAAQARLSYEAHGRALERVYRDLVHDEPADAFADEARQDLLQGVST